MTRSVLYRRIAALMAAVCVAAVLGGSGGAQAPTSAISIDNDDIGGVVTGPRGVPRLEYGSSPKPGTRPHASPWKTSSPTSGRPLPLTRFAEGKLQRAGFAATDSWIRRI